jgi:peptidoglycan/xylan/chitin deacetylase (PgdA/CDA1 family)
VGAGAHAPAAARAAARRVRARYAFFEGGRRMWGHGVGRKIVLTFDDGPYYQTTPRLLDHLDAFGVKAAFFVNSRNFDPDGLITGKSYKVLEEIHRRGHLLGNHTHSHPVLPSLTAEKQRKQIRLADRAIERITGAPSTLFRPPYGKLSPFAAKLLKKQGSTVVMWNLGSDDDKDFNVSKVVNNLMRKLERQGGGIILLHDTHYWSIEAVPSLLRAIRVESCKQLAAGEEPYEVTGLQYFHRPRQGARRTSPQDHRAWLQRRAALKRLCQTPAQAPVPAFIRGE